MLTAIRALAKSPLVGGFIVVLLIAAFALWGVNDIFRGGGNAAVLVGSERVSVQELNRVYERQIQSIQRENPRFTREQAEEFGLPDQIVETLTVQAAIDAKSSELGLALSDRQLADSIRAIQAFQNPFSGQFDRQTYLSVLQDNGYVGRVAERQFEAALAEELTRNQYVNAVLGGARAPDIMAQARRAFEDERRTLRALLIPPSLAGDVADPDDSQLETFIAENAQVFQRPEQRRFTLVRVSPALFEPDVAVREEDLQELYDFRLETGDLAAPPTRTFSQWPAPDAEAAEAAVARLAAGDDAGAVADALGLGAEVRLEEVQSFEVPDAAIADAAFAMTDGEARAVEGRLGWRVVRVITANDPQVPSLDDVRSDLVGQLAGDQAEGRMLDALASFEEARGGGATLEQAARQAGIPAEQFDWLTPQGQSPGGARAVTFVEAPEILQNAFSLPLGFAGDLETFGDGGYFVARVDAVEESRLPSVDEVRERATAFWRLRQVDEQLQAIVDDALSRAEAGESLEAIAAGLDGAGVESSSLGREETAGPFNAQLVSQGFMMPSGAVFSARASDGRTRAIVRVDQILSPPAALASPERLAALNGEVQGDLSAALQTALLSSYEIRRDQRLIDQALGRIDPDTLP